MIEMQDWLAPLLGSVVLIVVPLLVALMTNTIVDRLRTIDLNAHERRLDRRILPSRKEDERMRRKVNKQWDQIESYTRARNLCLLVVVAVVCVNLGVMTLALAVNSTPVAVSILAVLALVFAVSARFALKKPQRPIWATSAGYYRDLALGKPGQDKEEA